MKITFSGKITPAIIDSMLQEQKQKKEKIKEFCTKNNIQELQYKDSELEFEYHFPDAGKKVEKQFANPKPKVETRGGGKNVKD